MLWQAAGLTAGVYDKWTGTQTGPSNTGAVSNNTGVLANSGKVAAEGGLSTWGGVGQFAANQALQNVTSATLNKALGQDGDFGDALTSTLANTFAAAGFNWVGDISQTLDLKESGLAKIGLHAIMGGLAAEAAGSDFKSGALVAGANEALIDTLASQYDSMNHEQRSGLLIMNSQVLGVLVASMAGGDEEDMQIGASVAGNATKYNWELHLLQGMMTYRQAAGPASAGARRITRGHDGCFASDGIFMRFASEKMSSIWAGLGLLAFGVVLAVSSYYSSRSFPLIHKLQDASGTVLSVVPATKNRSAKIELSSFNKPAILYGFNRRCGDSRALRKLIGQPVQVKFEYSGRQIYIYQIKQYGRMICSYQSVQANRMDDIRFGRWFSFILIGIGLLCVLHQVAEGEIDDKSSVDRR